MTNASVRLFHHSITRPAEELVARCRRNVVVSRRANDVTIAAGALCSACNHLPEVVRKSDPPLAESIENFPRFDQLRDVADTHKHATLRKPTREIDLTSDLSYLFMANPPGAPCPNMFAFLRTEINAQSGRFPDEFDVIELIYEYIEYCAPLFGVDTKRTSFSGGSIFVGEPVMQTDKETISFEDFGVRYYQMRAGELPIRADPGKHSIQLINFAGIPLGKIEANSS